MTAQVIPIHDHLDRRWALYVSAHKRAQETQSIEDGIAAGRAWREWLNLFMSSDQRNFIDGSRGGMIG